MSNLLVPKPKHKVSHGFLATLRHLGAAGLFFLAILDSSPLPTFGGPDIVLAILAAGHRPLWYEYAATTTAGSVLGAYFTFKLARGAGAAYLDTKFKKSKLAKFLKLFRRWGNGTLIASTALPLPTPTSLFFAAAGAGDFPQRRFLAIVAACRAARYFGVAFIASHYGRHFLRVLRHPSQQWGWFAFLLALSVGLIIGGIVANRRLEFSQKEVELAAQNQD